MQPRKLSYLLQGYAQVEASQECDISGLSLDSRHASAGDLFFACGGGRTHGLRFLQHAMPCTYQATFQVISSCLVNIL